MPNKSKALRVSFGNTQTKTIPSTGLSLNTRAVCTTYEPYSVRLKFYKTNGNHIAADVRNGIRSFFTPLEALTKGLQLAKSLGFVDVDGDAMVSFEGEPECYLFDSGASNHMISRRQIPPELQNSQGRSGPSTPTPLMVC